MVPYEITLYTGDVKDAGTDAHIFVKVFGAGGSSSDIMLEKHSERFERGRIDLIKVRSILMYYFEIIKHIIVYDISHWRSYYDSQI